MLKVKICGLTRNQDVDIVNEVLPDYIGFVFAESRRKVTPAQAAALKSRLDQRVRSVGVFVNASIEEIISLYNDGVVDLVQLHGDEDAAYLAGLKKKIGCPVIKAVRVRSAQDVLEAEALPSNYLLLDAYKKEAYGGTGEAFDYALIPDIKKPFFIAGGLNAGNIAKAAALKPYCLDVSSGVETDGVKDAAKIWEIVRIIREERI